MADVKLADQIKCVERELALRQRCYPNWVKMGRMKQEKSDLEIAAMSAVLGTLRAKQEEELKV